MSAALTGLVLGAIALPHLLRLRRVEPMVAVTLWGSVLALRALTGVFIALWLVFFMPHSALFNAITHWCWEALIPLLATQLGLDGHQLGDAASIVPSFLLVASMLSVAFGVARAARSAQRLLNGHSLGAGPQDSVIVGGPEVVVAAAGIRRPQVIVTAGALIALDDDELAAGLEHERGHIARRHRFVMVFAELCRATARFLPGNHRAVSELTFHLERDADRVRLAAAMTPARWQARSARRRPLGSTARRGSPPSAARA